MSINNLVNDCCLQLQEKVILVTTIYKLGMDSIQLQRLISNILRCLGNRFGVIVIQKAQIFGIFGLTLPANGKLKFISMPDASLNLWSKMPTEEALIYRTKLCNESSVLDVQPFNPAVKCTTKIIFIFVYKYCSVIVIFY